MANEALAVTTTFRAPSGQEKGKGLQKGLHWVGEFGLLTWILENNMDILLMATRNPVNSPVELGSWNPIIYKVLATSKRWLFGNGISEASTVHGQYECHPNQRAPMVPWLGFPFPKVQWIRGKSSFQVGTETFLSCVFCSYYIIELVVEPTYLKNMRKSKWVHLPQIGVKISKMGNHHLVIHSTYASSVPHHDCITMNHLKNISFHPQVTNPKTVKGSKNTSIVGMSVGTAASSDP